MTNRANRREKPLGIPSMTLGDRMTLSTEDRILRALAFDGPSPNELADENRREAYAALEADGLEIPDVEDDTAPDDESLDLFLAALRATE